MARLPRSFTVRPHHAVHKVWRGHNREWNLETDDQKQAYLEFLNLDVESEKYKQGSTVNAITLMSNHSHEVFEVTVPTLFSNHMRRHHARYGAHFNRQKNRCGKVAQDRPHTTLLESEHQEMETVFYVHANPIRAKIVGDARNYFWSTHRLYAFGKRESWMRNVKLPAWYQKLGNTTALRQKAYRSLFARYLREKGRTRQKSMRSRFFGSAVWCHQNEVLVAQWRQDHSPP